MAEGMEIDDTVWKFSLDMFSLLCKGGGNDNVFVSPISIMAALSMTLAGARGETEKEMLSSLHLKGKANNDKVHKEMGNLLAGLSMQSKDGGVTTNLANKMFVEDSFSVVEKFTKILVDFYKAQHGKVDFIKNAAAAVKEINGWVEKETNGKIQDLVSSASINSATRLVLVNAIHFKGIWETPFEKAETIKHPFHVSSSEKIDVQMMVKSRKSMDYSFSEDLDCHCVRLPFKNRQHALCVIVPKKKFGLDAVEKKLLKKPELLREATSFCMDCEVEVLMLPRFTLGCQFDLEDKLPKLGIKQLFDSSNCDLSGITGDRSLVVSKVVHKSFLEVNEEGAEAAAATGVLVNFCAALMPEPVRVVADHPFLLAITVDDVQPLFLGRVSRPESK